MEQKKKEKNPKIYECDNCDYNTVSKKDYNKHLITIKHKRNMKKEMEKEMEKEIGISPKEKIIKKYGCECGKIYPYYSSLWKHKQKCSSKKNSCKNECKEKIEKENNIIDKKEKVENLELKELVMKLIIDNEDMKRENRKLMNHIVEIVPQIGNNNNNNTTNNIRQKFNINVFLNEKCKDALSIDEFIEKIEVSMKNLLTTKDKGLGAGLSNIILDNMNKLSVYERPIHCTDKKRETLYIKNKEWIKDETKGEINNLIKRIEKKQIKNIKQWTDKNPKFMENEKLQEEYIKLVNNSTSSLEDCEGKVTKNVCEKVYIDKE